MEESLNVRTGVHVNPRPRVSVIVAAYNTSKYISESLDSLLAQTYQDFEIIVVNDGSPDTPELEKVLEPFFSKVVYAAQENRGLAGARNTGLRLARAPYIGLLDSDDLWTPDYLEAQMRIIESDPSIDVVYPNARFFGDAADNGQTFMDVFPSHGKVTFESLLRFRCSVMGSVVARRESLIKAGGFDESLRSSEDFDMWLRILKAGGRIEFHKEVLMLYRRHSESLSASPVSMCRSILSVLGKLADRDDLTAAEMQIVSETQRRFRGELSLYEGKKAFFVGDAATAVKKLRESHRLLGRRKIALVIPLLQIAPNLIFNVYRLRDRYIFRTNTRF